MVRVSVETSWQLVAGKIDPSCVQRVNLKTHADFKQ